MRARVCHIFRFRTRSGCKGRQRRGGGPSGHRIRPSPNPDPWVDRGSCPQAEAAYTAEKTAGGGMVGRSGVASKLQSAADKFARMVSLASGLPAGTAPG